MSQIPSDPGTDSSRRRSLSYDELIALFVAFLTLGSVLFWGLTRSGVNLFGGAGLFDADGAPPLVGDADNQLQISDLTDELTIGELELDDGGIGTPGAIGAAGASSNVLGDVGRSAEQGTRPETEAMHQVNVPAVGTTTPGIPEVPQQAAQPATSAEEEATSAEGNVTAAPTTLPPLEVSREALQFQDVPDDFWAKPYIDALSERLVIGGLSEDTFAPDQPVTRAQLASAIAQAFPLEETEAGMAFSDIEADYWATDAIDTAVKLGFMNGFPDETFQPGLPIPRAQVLTALVTGINAATPEDAEAVVDRYGDANQIPSWAIGKMAAATRSGIVVNYPNLESLQPNQPATRAEVAAMIYQTLAAQGRVEAIDGDYVIQP